MWNDISDQPLPFRTATEGPLGWRPADDSVARAADVALFAARPDLSG
jgi:hypothetical protein